MCVCVYVACDRDSSYYGRESYGRLCSGVIYVCVCVCVSSSLSLALSLSFCIIYICMYMCTYIYIYIYMYVCIGLRFTQYIHPPIPPFLVPPRFALSLLRNQPEVDG